MQTEKTLHETVRFRRGAKTIGAAAEIETFYR